MAAVVAPVPEANQQDALGQRTAQDVARRILQEHKSGLTARRGRDLLSEKLLLHIDGSGDFQWADIYEDQRIVIPPLVTSGYKKTENILRPIVDNAVAYHTTSPLRYAVSASPDRRAQESAMIDEIWINYLAQRQDFNGIFAETLYLAMPAGFCTVHAYWRDDVQRDHYEPNGYASGASPGMIDCWVGNPFGTVFNPGAKRGSIRWASYERILNADMVRAAFAHVPGIEGVTGSTQIPSAAEFQRIARDWRMPGLGVHGSPVIDGGRDTGEELLTVICREWAPGVLPDWPNGRLTMIAVPGTTDLRRGQGGGHAVILADQELPGGDFSFSVFYSHHRFSDVHGHPWVEDIDQRQVDLNIAISKKWALLDKMADAPVIAPGGALEEDMRKIGGINLLEIDPSLSGWQPRVMEWPTAILNNLDREIDSIRSSMYTIGGYQAASRGEMPGSGTPYRAIVALQQADNTVHGPVNMRFKRSAEDFARRCHGQFRAYATIPWLVNIVGDEFSHLAEPYIDRTKVSQKDPAFRLVNAFGNSPELRAQEITNLLPLRGADGEPFLRTEEARAQYPNQMIFDNGGDPRRVQRRRAKTVAAKIHLAAKQFREQSGFDESQIPPEQLQIAIQQAAWPLFQRLEMEFKRRRDDDLQSHVATLSEITQDETADPIARQIAEWRQDLYYEWQAMQAGTGGAGGPQSPMGGAPAGGDISPTSGSPGGTLDPAVIAAQMGGAVEQGAGMLGE
jgi:hypothetical protein